MKRMNLIRVALFAVMTFVGTISLSAQNWLPPAQAEVVISNELAVLAEPPAAPAPTASIQTKQEMLANFAKLGCSDCELKGVKYQFLTQTMHRIHGGMTTGDAVADVRAFLIANANNNAHVLNLIQQAYEFMLLKLA